MPCFEEFLSFEGVLLCQAGFVANHPTLLLSASDLRCSLSEKLFGYFKILEQSYRQTGDELMKEENLIPIKRCGVISPEGLDKAASNQLKMISVVANLPPDPTLLFQIPRGQQLTCFPG